MLISASVASMRSLSAFNRLNVVSVWPHVVAFAVVDRRITYMK